MHQSERTLNDRDKGAISLEELKARTSLHGTLNSLMSVMLQAMKLALSKGRQRIAQMIYAEVTGSDSLLLEQNEDESEDEGSSPGSSEYENPMERLLPEDFQPLEREKHLELWKPFITPIADGQVQEWFSDPKKAKPLVIAKVKELRENLKALKKAFS